VVIGGRTLRFKNLPQHLRTAAPKIALVPGTSTRGIASTHPGFTGLDLLPELNEHGASQGPARVRSPA
jgi:hypothetical protein